MDENLLEPEFAPHFTAWKADPSPDNTTSLLKSVNPVLTAALRSYGNMKSPTLHSRAKIMALDAMKRYDPSRAKLKTHLMVQLQGLRRFSARENQILSVPEQVGLDLHGLRTAENELQDKLGRAPSDSELSDHMSMSLKRIAHIRKAKPSYSEGSFTRPGEDGGEDMYTPAVVDRTGAREWHEFVYHDLNPTYQLIMEHTLGLHGKPVLPNQVIAKRLGVSPGAVSQRKARLQEKLNLRDEFSIV